MIIEVATFRLASGVRDEQFLACDAAYQADLMQNDKGFVRRTVARNGDEWAVVSFRWSDEGTANAIADTSEAAAAFQRCVDNESFTVARYETLD